MCVSICVGACKHVRAYITIDVLCVVCVCMCEHIYATYSVCMYVCVHVCATPVLCPGVQVHVRVSQEHVCLW